MEQVQAEKTDYQLVQNVPQQFRFAHDEDIQQTQAHQRKYGKDQRKGAANICNRTSMLSPSALATAEAAQNSNQIGNRQSHARGNEFHRWPSVALDMVDNAAMKTSINTSFLLADEESDNDNANAGNNKNSRANSASPRRIPINILKLPWHHPFKHHESNSNPYKMPRALFAALFLTTAVALCSAWDAQNHCITDEMDALMELFEDQSQEPNFNNDNDDDQFDGDEISESAVLAIRTICKKMFRQVTFPVSLITCIGSLMALAILRQHQKSYGNRKMPDGAKLPLIDQSAPCVYSFYLPLLFVSGLILVSWTVGIVLVMLRPRSNDTDNRYSSLAAVDSMGRVADNANLYYFSWISEGIAILIFYQLGGALVRQHFHPSLKTTSPTTVPNATAKSADTGALVTPPPNSVSVETRTYFPWQRTTSTISHHNQGGQGSTGVSPKNVIQNPVGPLRLPISQDHPLGANLPVPTTPNRYHANRVRWFQTFYKLRVRTGIWVAAMLTSLVVVASSAHLFHEVLLPAAKTLFDDDDYLSDEEHHRWWNVIQDKKSYRKVCVILASHDSSVSEELCSRTFFSLLSGFFAVILCSTAIVLHILTRQSAAADALYYEACGGVYPELAMQIMANKHHHLPLRTELFLSFVLSLWLGWNAFLVSSVQGPAPKVGNLYYASWICFLLCLRICLGCVEEYFDIQDDEDHHHDHSTSSQNNMRTMKDSISASYRAPDLASNDKTMIQDGVKMTRKMSEDQNVKIERTLSLEEKRKKDKVEKERAKRLRRYFFLGIFSTVCAGSAIDAANNQQYALSWSDRFMILAPTTAAVLCAILFLLCLSKTAYNTISRFWCGGILSLLTFWLWLANLIVTMHSGDSWAVNGVGEIEMANLYYFSWASIITAGLQMMSFVKDLIGPNFEEDYMSVVWTAIGKVCFVILGAAGHIWHTISDHCDIVLIQYTGAISFCSKTVLAMVISGVGLFVGGLVVTTRLLVPARYFSTRSRAHCETIISIFLVLLFGVAAAMITGIGGPGQSVGDLYYSTWLAFWVSIAIFFNCYEQVKQEELEATNLNNQEGEPNKTEIGRGLMMA